MTMTENDKRAINLLIKHNGSLQTYCASVGELLYPKPKHKREGAPDNRRRQGLALAGAKVMRRLEKQGLITIKGIFGSNENVYSLTAAGKFIAGELQK